MKNTLLFTLLAFGLATSNAQTGFIAVENQEIITHFQEPTLTFTEKGASYVISGTDLDAGSVSAIRRSAGADMEMSVNEISSYGCRVSFVNHYDSPNYFIAVLPTADLSAFRSADEFYAFTYAQWQAAADAIYDTVDAYLEYYRVLQTASMEDVYVGGLESDTDYTLYAFGCTAKGERTTPVNRMFFRTASVVQYDVEFDIDVDVKGKNATMTVSPSDNSVPYYRGITDAGTLQQYGKPSVQENILAYLNDMLGFLHLDPEEFAKRICRKGESTYTDRTLPVNSTGYAYAFATDPALNLCSPMKIVEFQTGEIVNSDNVITTVVQGPSMTQAFVNFTPSNEDYYLAFLIKGTGLSAMSDEELVAMLEEQNGGVWNTWYYNKRQEPATLYASDLGVGPGEDVMAVAFGYEVESWSSSTSGKVTTDVMRTYFTMATEPLTAAEEQYAFYRESLPGDGTAVLARALEAGVQVYYDVVPDGLGDEEISDLIGAKAQGEGMSVEEYVSANSRVTQDYPYGEEFYLLLADGPSLDMLREEGVTEEYYSEFGITVVEPNVPYRILAVALNEDGSYAQPFQFSSPIVAEVIGGTQAMERSQSMQKRKTVYRHRN